MKRHIFSITSHTEEALRKNILHAAPHFSHFAFLDSNKHHDKYSQYDWLAAIGGHEIFEFSDQVFANLNKCLAATDDWLFGHLTYDLKNEVESLSSKNPRQVEFPPALFFVPQTVVYSRNGMLTAESLMHKDENELFRNLESFTEVHPVSTPVHLQPFTNRMEYLQKIASLKEHLQYGNIYEVNYCMEFGAVATQFDPLGVFEKLNSSTQAPFAAFYRNGDNHLLCASPERYLQKKGNRIISQPIKGTAKRSSDPTEDDQIKQELFSSEKERSENIMITDLVRNDLSRTAARASVKVDELFGIYTFSSVHQMISTISSLLDEEYTLADVLATTFPMGSMTGAPKVKAMQLIEEHETFNRNLYSGSVGYITPNGDADFNVVIRSLFFNTRSSYLSARVGSAITIHCDTEREYEECLLKAEKLLEALQA